METFLVEDPTAEQGNGKEIREKESVSMTLPIASDTKAKELERAISEHERLSEKLELVNAQLAAAKQRIVELDAIIGQENVEMLEEAESVRAVLNEIFYLQYGIEANNGYKDDDDDDIDLQELQNLLSLEREWKLKAEEEVDKLKEKIESDNNEPTCTIEILKEYLAGREDQQDTSFNKKIDEISKQAQAQLEKLVQNQMKLQADVKEMKQNLKRLQQIYGPPTLKPVTALSTSTTLNGDNIEPPKLSRMTLGGNSRAAGKKNREKRAKFLKRAKRIAESSRSNDETQEVKFEYFDRYIFDSY